ncbi:MAG: hypothetical protein Q9225_004634 [Loekoesia sp. 1 TL-2023]
MICHTKPYNYCCPRCSSRTCSLPCLKRHKQWASCNGIRDPAAYVKRSDLATPKGIDHDYNYLTSIERQFDIAERNFESRGIVLYDESPNGAKRKRHKPAKGEIPLENAIKQCRVVVDKAPKGMSRQRQNATHWDKKNRRKRIIWTVEWVHKNGSRETGQCPDTEPIGVAYTKVATSRAAEATAEAGGPRKKLRTDAEVSRPAALASIPQSKELPMKPTMASTAPTPLPQPQTPDNSPSATTNHQEPANLKQDPPNTEPPPISAKSDPPAPPPLHFYLLLPSTPTSYRVLIPLEPTDTLTTALTDRLVLEFPTIYALKQPPDKLPTGFMTEEEYLRSIAEKGNVNQHLDGLLNGDGELEHQDMQVHGRQDVEEGALRDVLKKDLVREVDGG